jgi:mono/diheme cytochrome c family protein
MRHPLNPGTLLQAPGARAALIFSGYLAVAGGVLALRTKSDPPPGLAPGVRAGQVVWRRGNCQACHALYGLGGQTGPDLTNILRVRGTNLVRTVVATGRGDMPAFAPSEADLDALVTYLDFLDRSGDYPPRTRPPPIFGRLR